MGNLKLTIPSFVSKEHRVLTHLYTLPHEAADENHVSANVGRETSNKATGPNKTLKYVLHDNKNHFEIVDGKNLAFTEAFIRRSGEDKNLSTLAVKISVEDSSGHLDNTTVTVDVMRFGPVGESKKIPERAKGYECDFLLSNLCYWQAADYRIYENRRPSIVGTLGSSYLQSLCPGYRINYTIANQDDRISLSAGYADKDNDVGLNANNHRNIKSDLKDERQLWKIRTLKPLERDFQRSPVHEHNLRKKRFAGELINFTVHCFIEDINGSQRKESRKLSLKVLDENDNPPKHQDDSEIFIKYDHPKLQKKKIDLEHRQTLIFIDLDSPAVNSHKVKLLNDTLDLFDVKCNESEDDRYGEPQTIISCDLHFKREVDLDAINVSNYTVILQINDTTMMPGHGPTFARVPIHLTHPKDNRLKTLIPPKDVPPLLLYKQRDYTIFRLAAPLARVANPPLPVASNIGNFTLLARKASYLKTFNITKSEGIIYVNNITSLWNSESSVRLDVQWERDGKLEVDQLRIAIYEEASNTCHHLHDNLTKWSHCTSISNPYDCKTACAIGTGGHSSVAKSKSGSTTRCQWRGNETVTIMETTNLYQTCTVDTETCPDGRCDSLEQMNSILCPLDCTSSSVVPTALNPLTGRGIARAAGVCTCTRAQCVCGEKISKSLKAQEEKKRKRAKDLSNKTTSGNFENVTTALPVEVVPNLSRHVGMEIASCGSGCLLGILAVCVFVLTTIGSIVVCWRLGKVHKVRGKFNSDHNDLSAPLSDYIDRGLLPENAITLNFDMTTSLAHNTKVTPDPKWEFPRSQLFIEQTLGEGEFGRVLRARAKDISGHSGYTIVAVKTLKDDARDGELTDLLSEYHLLKEVSHPNIIKLLGASTLPGGPVYLIIEYAQYGSLRSYLRRSRHLKSETHLPRVVSCMVDEAMLAPATPNDNYDEPKTCKVTPKDILSFAWQIANGMTYLSEIKLVHRDLAARNVLLSKEKVCKISDFGLTRDIYEDDAYFKRSKGRVPVKWMAPESLSDHVYTCKSDVWSYGILIWELVTLGATPYPGIQVQNLFHLLTSGYRMERPENCSVPLYKIMKSCWTIEAEQRPSFHDLSNKFEKMLEDQVEYLDLTANAIHNRSYFCTINGETDDGMDNQDVMKSVDKDDNDAEDELETNLEKNSPRGKFRSTEQQVEKKISNLLENNNELIPELSPLKTGYETPIKTQYANSDTAMVASDPIQYYTNMEASKNVIK
ncbi:uncharacterized protein Ret [Atheta coriaria]|uniref:uncharacterized protein Ret n=1 Tax=Dalotia coriaria TaxID=877792 RepID=UPI0031F44BB3